MILVQTPRTPKAGGVRGHAVQMELAVKYELRHEGLDSERSHSEDVS